MAVGIGDKLAHNAEYMVCIRRAQHWEIFAGINLHIDVKKLFRPLGKGADGVGQRLNIQLVEGEIVGVEARGMGEDFCLLLNLIQRIGRVGGPVSRILSGGPGR